MSASSLFSLSSTLTGGVQSTLSTWALGRFGVISEETAPVLKGAFSLEQQRAQLIMQQQF